VRATIGHRSAVAYAPPMTFLNAACPGFAATDGTDADTVVGRISSCTRGRNGLTCLWWAPPLCGVPRGWAAAWWCFSGGCANRGGRGSPGRVRRRLAIPRALQGEGAGGEGDGGGAGGRRLWARVTGVVRTPASWSVRLGLGLPDSALPAWPSGVGLDMGWLPVFLGRRIAVTGGGCLAGAVGSVRRRRGFRRGFAGCGCGGRRRGGVRRR